MVLAEDHELNVEDWQGNQMWQGDRGRQGGGGGGGQQLV